MGTAEEAGKVATATVESLKSQPLALALVLINVLYLAGGLWSLHNVADAFRTREMARDQLVASLALKCEVPSKEKGAEP